MAQEQNSQPGPPTGVALKTPSLVTTSLLAIAIVFPILATTSILVRCYCRRIKSQALKADDWTIIIALLTSWAQSINVYVAAGRAGVDTTTLPPLQAARVFLLCLWIEGFPLAICLPAIKISILLFYNRIFTIRPFRLSVYFASAVLTAWAISTCVGQLLAGNPINSVWNPLAATLRYNYQAFSLAVAGMSLIFDVLVLCFPFPVIRTLNMPTKRKVSITGIFWLGGFCCIAAAVRIYYLNASATPGKGKKTYENATNGFIWAHIEPNLSIIAACLPTYGPLFTSGGPTFISKLRSRIASLISASGSARRFRGKKSSGASSSSPSAYQTAGSKPKSANDDDLELIRRDRKEHRRTPSHQGWVMLENEPSMNTEIMSDGRGCVGQAEEGDLESGLEKQTIGPSGIVVKKGMKVEEEWT